MLLGEKFPQLRPIPTTAYLLQYLGLDTFFQLREECDAGVIGAVHLAIRFRLEKAIGVELLAEDLSFFGCAHPYTLGADTDTQALEALEGGKFVSQSEMPFSEVAD